MRSRFSKALLISLMASATACVTTPKRHPKLPPQQPIEKEGQKIPGGEIPVAANDNQNTPAAATPGPAAQDGPGLWSRTNNMQVPMNEDDLMRATQLYPTAPGSLEEAIFVVTQMRMLQKDWERRSAFQTQDLHTNQKADNTAGLSLEKTFQDLEVDLAAAIRGNRALKNHDSLLLAKQLLTHTKNSAVFNVNVNAAIRERASEWPDVLAEDVATPASANEAPSPAATDAVPIPGTPANPDPAAAAVPPAAAAAVDANAALDLMGSDTLLIAAQKLADKRDYKAALDHVSRIKKEDPFYAQAQEKQKLFSNRAVKDLRQKAAEAFSNAAPLNDTRAKGNYLKQAKNYLEQALRDFPMADQLDTVRENLEAVNRDLEAIDKSGT